MKGKTDGCGAGSVAIGSIRECLADPVGVHIDQGCQSLEFVGRSWTFGERLPTGANQQSLNFLAGEATSDLAEKVLEVRVDAGFHDGSVTTEHVSGIVLEDSMAAVSRKGLEMAFACGDRCEHEQAISIHHLTTAFEGLGQLNIGFEMLERFHGESIIDRWRSDRKLGV